MTTCPQCSTPIDDSFGPKSCASCGALVFIDMDGNVEATEPTGPSIGRLMPDSSVVPTLSRISISQQPQSRGEDIGLTSVFDPMSKLNAIENSTAGTRPVHLSSEVTLVTNGQVFPADQLLSLIREESLESQKNILPSVIAADEHVGLHSEDEFSALPNVLVDSVDENLNEAEKTLKSIVSFANSQQSEQKDGQFLYDLNIQGLDTEQLKKDFQLVLNDPRLRLNVPAILKETEMGQVTLTDLSAIRLSVIVQRLKEMPLEISWSQRRVVGPDSERTTL